MEWVTQSLPRAMPLCMCVSRCMHLLPLYAMDASVAYLCVCIEMHSSVQNSVVEVCVVEVCVEGVTGWRRLIGSPKLQIIFHKRATKCRALLRKMTYKDKGSYESSPPCTKSILHLLPLCICILRCIHVSKVVR